MGNPDGSRKFKGLAWLFLGVPYSNSLLYVDEHDEYLKKYPDNFRVDYAVSREQKNEAGQKMYIQTKMGEYAEELWELMQSPKTHIYMCDKAGTCFPDAKVYRGVCSNFICDMTEGDEVLITGPTGAEMLLPNEQDCNIIMLATGTGIAPMRSYMRLLFHDKVGANADGSRKFQGLAWLFLGVPYSNSLLYVDEHDEYTK